jgi:hypothetical protein
MAKPPTRPPEGVVFRGHSRADVKRKAVRWWSRNAEATLTLRQFLAGCRMGASERLIVFAPARGAAA